MRKALDTYDQAVAKKDVETVRSLLAPDLLLYEHCVRNDGAKDAFENHLRPSKTRGLSFSDLRITASPELALVTRQYRVRGTFEGKAIDSAVQGKHEPVQDRQHSTAVARSCRLAGPATTIRSVDSCGEHDTPEEQPTMRSSSSSCLPRALTAVIPF